MRVISFECLNGQMGCIRAIGGGRAVTHKVKTRRYSIPHTDDATILSIFDTAAHYAADKRTVSIMIGHRALPAVQTLYGLQRRHPEVDWSASRLIDRVSASYGPMDLHFVRGADNAQDELSLITPDGGQVTDMVRFIASRSASLHIKQDTPGLALAGIEDRRRLASRVVRARRLRLCITAPDTKTWMGAIRTLLPVKTYIPMRAVAGRLRSSPQPTFAVQPRQRPIDRRYVSMAMAALVTLLAGAQAVALLHPA